MKIARASLLNALAPGLIPALLLLLVPVSETIAQTAHAGVQQVTLMGSEKDVVGTTTSGSLRVVRGTFTEFSLPKGTTPQLMASSADGNIFYALGGGNKIAMISSATSVGGTLSVKQFSIPTANSFPVGLVVAADGTVWFAEQNGHQIGRLDPKTGVISEFKTPTANSGPVGITVGPDGAIWFTEAFANKIGRLDPATEAIEEFAVPTPVSTPLQITSGPDGGLWYVGVRGNQLGRIDPTTRTFAEYPTVTAKSGPSSLVVGPDGAIWISELNADKIARFDVNTKTFTDEIPVSSHKNGPRSGPGMLVNGPDGNIWFSQMFGNQIARLNLLTKEIHEFAAPTATATSEIVGAADTAAAALLDAQAALGPGRRLGPTSGPGGIAFGSDGSLWYTGIFGNLVSRFRVR